MIRPQTMRYEQSASPVPRPVARREVPEGAWLALGLLLLLGGWRLLVMIQGYPAFVLPTPELVAWRFWQELTGGTLWHHTSLTLTEALGGFSLALMFSLALGYLLAHTPVLERVLSPLIAGVHAVPVVAVAPLIILWVGTGIESRILVAALVTFFPILVSTIVALRAVPRELIEMATISGANRWQMLWLVEAPLALRGIFGGIKAGLSIATTGAVVGEFVGGRDGLGALINISRGLFDTPLMFVALVMLAIITLVFYLGAILLERALIRWDDEALLTARTR